MDWRLGHPIYELSLHHHWVGSLFDAVELASIPLVVVATGLLWFLGRPGAAGRRWKVACASAYAAAAVAYLLAFVMHQLWARPRPYVTHAIAHPWSNATDPSFPSDHTTVSFAIAWVVFAFSRRVGALFLALAAVISIGRLFIAAHYPGDVATGVLVGGLAALIVVRLLRPFVVRVVKTVERLTDPLLDRIAGPG
jgi:undecaprenyl-diphosphatase